MLNHLDYVVVTKASHIWVESYGKIALNIVFEIYAMFTRPI